MNLPPLTQSFVLHFGEMGSRWGISRTVGQIYALLFLAEEPLNADEITEKLGFSRSNVSMGLKELSSWRLVKLQHKPGDRREYFSMVGGELHLLSDDESIKIDCGRTAKSASCTFRLLPSAAVQFGHKAVAATMRVSIAGSFETAFESSRGDQFVVQISEGTMILKANKSK